MANLVGELSSGTTKTPVYSPDVFLSFAGKDTRYGFTGYLYDALSKKGINTFRDDKTLRKGKSFAPELMDAIKESKISIVVLSKGYRYSKWCLSELVQILQCIDAKEPRQIYPQVYPIFYKMEPSDIRDETKFETAIKELNEKQKAKNKPEFNPDLVEKWRDALLSVGRLEGYHLQDGFYEHEFIERIVIDVFKLVPKRLYVGEHIVGLESRVEEVKSLLDVGSELSNNNVCMLLIHGTGGIGKTTLAKLLFNEIVHQFEGASFLSNVKEETSNQPSGLASLQKLLLKEAHGEDIDFGNDAVGASKIKKLLRNKKILLVLDDVDDKKQLKKLAGECDWFGSGSRIIITSRDNRLLNENQVNNRSYKMKELKDWEALECLCWYAFDDSQPAKGFEDVAMCAVKYAKGLPLALEVIGSDLNGEDLEEWECALRDFEKNQHQDILHILERSYYRLGRNERQNFLDIACLFYLRGRNLFSKREGEEKRNVEMLLQGCEHVITLLNKKSLVTVTSSGNLWMHDLIQQMSREIILKEGRNPGDRSRLWNYEDVVDVLTNNSGTDKIEGMVISITDPEQEACVKWSGTAFYNMNNLRTLIVENLASFISIIDPKQESCVKCTTISMMNSRRAHIIKRLTFSKPPTHLPNSLSWLKWDNYPSATLPPTFSPNKLIVLELPHSNISESILEPLKGTYLSRLNLSFCPSLLVIPNVSRFPNLRELILHGCENLTKIDDYVGSSSKLIILDLSWCKKLKYFPHKIKMPSLEAIGLSGCESLQYFPDIEGQINTLESIWLSSVRMEKLPESINNITGLKDLSLSECPELKEMPMFKLKSLKKLRIWKCPQVLFRKSQAMQENDSEEVGCPHLLDLSIENCNLSDDSLATILSWYPKLACLNLQGNSFTSIPQCIEELVDLRKFYVRNCGQLQNIPELPSKLSTIYAYGCKSLTSESTTMLLSQACKNIDGLHICFNLPESKIFIPSQYRRLSNCVGIVSFQIGRIFPFAAFAFILEREELPEEALRVFHSDMVQLFINGLLVNETRLSFTEGEVVIVDLRNCEKSKSLDSFLVNDWNDVDVRVYNYYSKCQEYLKVYGVLCNEEQMDRCPLIWQNIWNWPGPERIRDFLWLMVQGKLFTNSQRRSQHLSNSDNCLRCGSSGETVMHAIRDCESIANLWQKLIKPCHWECFSSTSVCMQDWVLKNLSNNLGRDDGLDWKVTFGFACWTIWVNRNDLAFDNSANGAIAHGDRARESIEAISRAIESQSHARLEWLNSWELPPNDWVKFNVSIFLRGGHVNCGCAIRDATGSWIFEVAFVPDRAILEYAGVNSDVLIGLMIARMKGFKKIIIEVHYQYDNWFHHLHSKDGPIDHIMSKNCWQVHIHRTKIERENISRKMADLVHNSEQCPVDFPTIHAWLKLDYVEGLKVFPIKLIFDAGGDGLSYRSTTPSAWGGSVPQLH